MRSRLLLEATAISAPAVLFSPGVTIGEGCVVRAGSVVKGDVEAWEIVEGNSAVVVGGVEGGGGDEVVEGMFERFWSKEFWKEKPGGKEVLWAIAISWGLVGGLAWALWM